MSKLKIAIVILLILAILAVATFAVVSNFKKKTDKDFSKRTAYDLVKRTKSDNYNRLNKSAKQNQTVFIGDSITEIYFVNEHYADYIKSSQTDVYNRGISGDTSDRMLERLEANALSIMPKNLVVLIGTNDLGAKIDISFTANNIREIILKTKQISPETNLIIEAVYPVNYNMLKSMVGNRKNSDILKLNSLIKTICEEEKVTYLDLTDKLKNADGNLDSTYSYDGLHLNNRGFEVVTANIAPLLK